MADRAFLDEIMGRFRELDWVRRARYGNPVDETTLDDVTRENLDRVRQTHGEPKYHPLRRK